MALRRGLITERNISTNILLPLVSDEIPPWMGEYDQVDAIAEPGEKVVDQYKFQAAQNAAFTSPDKAIKIIAHVENDDAPPTRTEQPPSAPKPPTETNAATSAKPALPSGPSWGAPPPASEDDERKHQAEKAGDIPGLASDITDETRDVAAEQRMWKIFGALFNAIPRELFTWGLRPHDSAYTDDGSLCLDRAFSRELECLMSHPIWKGDKAELRYVLQTAVSLRVADHTPPMGPLGATITKIACVMLEGPDGGMSSKRGPEVPYDLYKASGPGARKHLQPLLENMKRLILKKPIANEMERQLFLLQIDDVRMVRRALDTSLIADRVPWPMSTQEFHAEFRGASSEVYDRISPESLEKLADLKAAVEIADSRDEKIRANILRVNLGSDVFLHNRPDFGPGSEASYPCGYYLHPEVGPTAGLVIKGPVPDPKRVGLFGPPAWQLVAAAREAKRTGFPPGFKTTQALKTLLLPPERPGVAERRIYALFPSRRDVEVDQFLMHEAEVLTSAGSYWDNNRDVMSEKPQRHRNTESLK
ncbi:hypothetical protein DL764_007187 [Monosporascus ibericus]|uniref:Uncharacterized protein n=1 Tax=Monosporascus ibericus TaxID=155417 RepID=A0A4V1X9V5_9PEZI|nr:hypothetical protein DL764_007187 [Monosporascus ibericus]